MLEMVWCICSCLKWFGSPLIWISLGFDFGIAVRTLLGGAVSAVDKYFATHGKYHVREFGWVHKHSLRMLGRIPTRVKSPINILATSLWGRRAMNGSGIVLLCEDIDCLNFLQRVLGLAGLAVRRRRQFKASQSITHGIEDIR